MTGVPTRVFRESMVNRDKIGRFAEKASKGGGASGNAAFLAKFSAKIAAKAAASNGSGGNALSGLSGVKAMDAAQLSGVKPLSPAQLSAAKTAHEGKNAAFLAKLTAKIQANKTAETGAKVDMTKPSTTGVVVAGPAVLPKKKSVSPAPKEPKASAPTSAPAKPGPREFKPVSTEQAAQLQAQMLKGKPWTAAQRESLRTYTGVDYTDMNGALRFGGGSSRINRHITNARAGMRETPEDVTVYRGMGSGSAFGFPKNRKITNAQLDALVGQAFHDPGFTSTATRSGGYGSGLRVQAVINVPAGSRGAFVEEITQNKGEDEFVLDAGTHFKITKYERHKGGKVTLYMEVLKQDA